MTSPSSLSRRTALTGFLSLGAGLLTAGCGPANRLAGPSAIEAAESARPGTGRIRSFALTARRTQIDLGGEVVDTWTYGDGLPGTPIRATAGDRVRVNFRNQLPQ